jgi:hypothetical protein
LAVGGFRREFELNCILYQLNEDESLQFILTHHQSRSGWNDFVRIRSVSALEPEFQQRAVDNMRAGGSVKGLASCPKLNTLMYEKRLPAPQGLVAVTSGPFSRSRTRD